MTMSLDAKPICFFFASTPKEKNVACMLMYPFLALRGVVPSRYETKHFASCRAYKGGKKEAISRDESTVCYMLSNHF